MLDRDDIYRDYRDKIYGYVYNRIRNPHDAEDIVSCIFLKIYEKLPSYDQEKASLSTWIYTITRNTLTDHFRSHGRVIPSEDETFSNLTDSDVSALDQLVTDDTMAGLAEALKQLPERERDVIILRFYHDYTPQQVADKLKVTNTNARHIQWSAVNRLRSILANQPGFM